MDYKNKEKDTGEVREPAVAYGKSKFTIEEYLEMERASQEKHEYYQGEIFVMTRPGTRHNLIFSNLYGDLAYLTKGTPCRSMGSDMRVHIPENTLFTYPDISIFCGEMQLMDDDNAIGPTALIEILSPSTRNYDRGMKFGLYKQIPSLKEYIMIDLEKMHVYGWRIDEKGQWQLQEYTRPDDVLHITTVDLRFPLSDIYADTRLS